MRHIIHAVILAAFMSVGVAHAGGYNEKLAGWLDKAKNDPAFAAHVLRMGTDGYPLAVVYAAGGNALVEAELLKRGADGDWGNEDDDMDGVDNSVDADPNDPDVQ